MNLINRTFDSSSLRTQVRQVLRERSVMREFGNRVIDRIIERTQKQNIDKNGKKFRGYSENYINSDVFSIYGKSASDVNLTLTSEMLSSMVVEDVTTKGPVIGFASENQSDKAEGHIKGIPRYFGKKKGKVKRDFFGIPEKDQQQILKDVVREYNEENSSEVSVSIENLENG